MVDHTSAHENQIPQNVDVNVSLWPWPGCYNSGYSGYSGYSYSGYNLDTANTYHLHKVNDISGLTVLVHLLI